MTVISAIFMHIPVFSGYFSVAGRLSGFFQYPNTYALLALIGVILLLSGGKFDIIRFIMLLLLAGGIVCSGSRTVAVMTVFFVAVMLIRSGSRRLKIIIPLSIGAILAAAAVYALISGNFGSVGRFLMLSLNESTFIGRIIYFKDGLRLIAKNPSGLGYLGFYYTENMKTVVSCDTEKSGKYKMPSSVTGVVYGAFTNCTKLTEVKLSPALTSVVYKIFINCTSLKTVTVPDSVVSVDAGAFENCTALSEISLPNTVISIGMDAFYCSGLTKINLPQQLKWIDSQAFAGSKLKSISILKSVSYISYNAFANAPLVSLTLPSSEMQIGYAAFAHTSLTELTLPSGPDFGNYVFGDCQNLKKVTIVEGRTELGYEMFRDCNALETVVLPSTLNYINGEAFLDCKSLKNISLPENITTIEKKAFKNCASLKYINLPQGLSVIGASAFEGCALTSVRLPENLAYLGTGAFSGCPLSELEIKNISEIGGGAFAVAQITRLVLPDTVTTIAYRAFADCSKLLYIEIPESVIIIKSNDHKFGNWTTVKTQSCHSAGERTHECSVCRTKETESIPAEHRGGLWYWVIEPEKNNSTGFKLSLIHI